MTANPHSIDLAGYVEQHLQPAEPDVLRTLLRSFAQALMSAEADAACGLAAEGGAGADHGGAQDAVFVHHPTGLGPRGISAGPEESAGYLDP